MRSERMISLTPTICQAARNSATAAVPTTTRAEAANDWRGGAPPAGSSVATVMSRRGSRGRLLPGVRCQHLLGEQIPDALAVGCELGIVADFERARPRERHLEVGDHAARRSTHHHDAVGE